MAIDQGDKTVTPTEIHDVLSNERRQRVLKLLSDEIDPMSVRDLSERIAAAETNQSPPPRNVRQSAYVSLHQTHLPMLDERNIINYDEDGKMVSLEAPASKQVNRYMDPAAKSDLAWSEYSLGLAFLGLLLVIASEMGVPLIGSVDAFIWAGLPLLLIAGTGLYKTISPFSSFGVQSH